MKYFFAGFCGMLVGASILFGLIALLVTYCPIPTGTHKYLVTAGIISAGALMLVTVVVVGAIALQSE